jgi:hypothetical protein
MPTSKNPGSGKGQGNDSTNKGRNKTEAVRQALDELGQDAKAAKIQNYLKDRLGMEATTKQITDARSKILQKAAGQGQVKEALALPQGSGSASSDITKMEGVRRALAELGPDAKPVAIRDYLQNRFGMEISRDVVSVYKRDLKAEGQEKAREKSETGGESVAQPQQSEPAPASKGQAGIPLPDILTIKDLVERLGAGPLHTLIDAFAR